MKPRHLARCFITTTNQSATVGRAVNVMDATPPPYPPTGSSSRYAGVARYLASLEMAGSDLEAPPGHPDTYAKPDDDDRPQQQAACAAKPEMKDDDVTQRNDTSPALRLRRQVVKLIIIIIIIIFIFLLRH